MAWKRGKGVGFVIVRTRPNEPAQVLGPGSASAGGEIRIFADEGTADRDARRLQEELRDPWIQPAELVLRAEPDVLV